MRPLTIKILLPAVVACSITSCATSGFDEVRDPKVRQELEAKWKKSVTLTAYYPDRKTSEEVGKIMKLKGIKDSDVSETFYFSLAGGGHTIYIETDEKDGHARYHCIGFNKDREVAIFWVQFQDEGKPDVIETMQLPKAPQGVADVPH